MISLPLSKRKKENYVCYSELDVFLWNEIKVHSFLSSLNFVYLFDLYEINERQVRLTYLSHPSEFRYLFTYLFEQKHYIRTLFYSFYSILKKLECLNSHSLFYMNPYPLSYLIRFDTDIYLSNFSYAFLSNKIKKRKFYSKIPFFKNMNKDYPLEIHFLYSLLFEGWETLDNEKIESFINRLGLEKEKQEIIDFYTPYINEKKEILIELLFSFHETWDIFILSKMYLPIFLCLKTCFGIEEFKEILILCSHPLPIYRKKYSFLFSYFHLNLLKHKKDLFS